MVSDEPKSAADGGQLTLLAIKEFAEELASRCLADAVETGQSFGRKEVNDPLWGTVSLTPSEVALLDTPLIQRLRYVRQLGVAQWTYPGAIHTRLSHTLGALHQVQTLASAINVAAAEAGEPLLIAPMQIRILRLAALLHDIGHCAFSHVTEKALAEVTNVDLVVAEFQRPFRLENKHLSEVLAYYAVKSPALTSFLKTIWAGCSDLAKLGQGTEDTVMQLQDAIARAIIGLVIDNKIPLLHELISGPFDADKLDYYARDNHLAGTPSALDISRLIQKITVRPFTREDLPPRIAQSVKTGLHSYWLFGIKWSGLAVLDELHLTRVLLYSKIYHHAKVIAVERMIQSFAAELAQVVPAADLLRFFYDLADDTILHLSTEELQRKFELKEPLSQEQREHLTCASGILRSIRDRRLVVKAFQLHGRYPDDAEGDSRSREGLAEMAADLRSPIRAPQLIDKVLKDIELLLEKLSAEGPGRRDIRQLRREVLFHMQKPEAGGAQINRAFLMPSMGKPVPFKAGVVNKHGWVSSYFSDHPEVAGLVETAFRR